ncbi:MAG: twin-arginine translocase TatA/TatE family subunit [Lentisphaeria bacterium]|nr:twin-arginine translocase TatA/TatE family subunit [Lentisphaeria bacterium]MBR3688637.1 twin-arginine translocase TatA/TatE family subunit [Lentisphaeria bacterium]
MHLGPMEIALILIVILLLFGAKRIPEIARSLGRASQEYKKAKEDFLAEVNKPAEDAKDAVEDKSAPAVNAAKEDKDSGESAKS